MRSARYDLYGSASTVNRSVVIVVHLVVRGRAACRFSRRNTAGSDEFEVSTAAFTEGVVGIDRAFTL